MVSGFAAISFSAAPRGRQVGRDDLHRPAEFGPRGGDDVHQGQPGQRLAMERAIPNESRGQFAADHSGRSRHEDVHATNLFVEGTPRSQTSPRTTIPGPSRTDDARDPAPSVTAKPP